MKIQGVLVSSPKFDLFLHTPLRFLSNYRTEIFDNRNSRMKLQHELNNVRCLEECLCLYDEMRRMRPLPSVIQFTQLLSRLVKLEEYSAAVRLYSDFFCLRIPIDGYTMTIAVNSYCHLNRVDFGFSILGSSFKRGCVADAFTYSALIKGLFRENKRNEALEIFKKIVRERLCELDVVLYGVVIDGYCHLNRVDFGFSILGSLFKRGCVPDAFTYSALIKGLFRENKRNEALEFFKKIVRERLCELDVVLYGVVIDGLCKAGDVAAAMDLLRIMEKGSCKPNMHIYSMVIDALCKEKQVDSALKLFDEMSEKGIRPNVFTYNSLICGMCSLNRWGEVDILLKQMMEHKVHPNVVIFNSLINALCNEGLVDRVEHGLNIMKHLNVDPNVVTYNTWMHGYCLLGRLDDAKKVFDSMAYKSITPNVCSFTILIDGYCKIMKIEEAMHLLQALKRKGLEPNVFTYNSVLHGLFRVGRCTDARTLFDKLQADGIKLDFQTYTTMLDGLFHCGNSEGGQLLLDELEQKGDVHISYYNVVMNAFCEEGELDKVRAIFRGLGSKGLEPNVVTYGILIKGCCQHILLDEAKDLILQMEQTSLLPSSIIYNCIAQACLKRGLHDDAAVYIEEMVDKGFDPDPNTLELVLSLPGTVENNPTLLRIARKLAPETFRNKNMGENGLEDKEALERKWSRNEIAMDI